MLPLRWTKALLILVLFLALILLSAACEEEEEAVGETPTPSPAASPAASPTPRFQALEKVTFMAGFKPQANLPFVGVYVASEKGFFEAQGLDVEIQHVSTPGENFKFLATGQVQFSTADAAVVLERRTGDPPLPIVAIALIGQRGQQGFAVLADSGIRSPKDWEGKTVGYKGTKPTPDYLAILKAEGVDRDKIEEVRVGFEPQILTEGRVDVFPVFLSNEPYTLGKLGYEVKLFEAADYGIPTLGLTYVTTEDYIAEKPGVVEPFLKAALKGIEYARDNPAEAVDIVMEVAPQEVRDHMQFMLETELTAAESELTREKGLGWMTDEQWTNLYGLLLEYEALSQPLDDLSVAYNTQFLERIYKDGQLQWP